VKKKECGLKLKAWVWGGRPSDSICEAEAQSVQSAPQALFGVKRKEGKEKMIRQL
jgi:hypothetical protein